MLAEPIHELAASVETEGDWGIGMLLYRSPETFRYVLMRELSKEFVTVGNRFQIRPLLGLLSHEQRCYLLALSQKHVRLFDCTDEKWTKWCALLWVIKIFHWCWPRWNRRSPFTGA